MPDALSRFYGSSYEVRALVVLVALGAIALWDLRRRGTSATRWREYGFWISCGGLGAVFGMANDAVTSRISLAYFVVGKGLTDDPQRVFAAVIALGAEAGSFAGVVVGPVLLLANNPSHELPQLPYSRLAIFLVAPTLGALLGAVALGMFSGWDVQGLAPALSEMLTKDEVRGFLAVHRAHAGRYVGGILATVAAAMRIRRERRALVDGPRVAPHEV